MMEGRRSIRQLPLCQHNLLSTSIIFQCLCWTLRKLISAFRASEESSVIFRASTGPSVNFCQLSLTLRDLPSTSVKFPWVHGIFREHSVNFPCVHGTCYQPSVKLRNLVATFRASTGTSVNIPYLNRTFGRLPSTFVHPRDLP